MANVTKLMIVTAAAALAAGCAGPRTFTKTEYVVTPTYCSVTMPERPRVDTEFVGNPHSDYSLFVTNLQRLLVYTDELEMALLCCTNSHDCVTKKVR